MRFYKLLFFLLFTFCLYSIDKTIPDTFFGLHQHKALEEDPKPWPTVPFKTWRLWDAGICWPEIQPKNSKEWKFDKVDEAVKLAQKNNVELVINIGLTPKWAAARPKDKSGYGENLTASEPKDIDDWRNYVKTLAERYKGKIRYWEIWNEPDMLMFYTGSIKKMVELTKEAYNILKAADPENMIISPPVTGYLIMLPWLDSFLTAGGKDYIDIIGTHLYVWDKTDSPETMIARIQKIKEFAASSNISNKPIWDTECGFRMEIVTNKELQSGYIARLSVIQWYYGVKRVIFYSWDNRVIIRMNDSEYTKENNVGIAFRETQNWLVGAKVPELIHVGNNIWIARLTRNNAEARMIWENNDWNPDQKVKYTIPQDWNYLTDMKKLTAEKDAIPANRTVEIGVSPILFYDKKFFDKDE